MQFTCSFQLTFSVEPSSESELIVCDLPAPEVELSILITKLPSLDQASAVTKRALALCAMNSRDYLRNSHAVLKIFRKDPEVNTFGVLSEAKVLSGEGRPLMKRTR